MTISKAKIDSGLRTQVFETLNIANIEGFHRLNDRQWGILLTDENGVERYVRIGAIVAEIKDDMTAREYMQAEIDKYETTQASKMERAKARQEKAKRDKEKREKNAEAIKEMKKELFGELVH